ncbi:MAG: hypothetical protein BAJALOKI2v1_670003 [Promethearchaeota archaeon]|nr:MAG: hypothetical protein BAJALOKI2v1_670003 [Candidatus Lokiarchaeota archaeon]
MGKRKSNLTDEDRKIIRELKEELSMMGVPRDEWSYYIQQELVRRKKEKSKGKKSWFSKVFDKIKSKISGFFQKLMMKRFNIDENYLNELMEGSMGGGGFPSAQDEFMDSVYKDGLDNEEIEELGKQSTTLKPDQKRMVISFDDED